MAIRENRFSKTVVLKSASDEKDNVAKLWIRKNEYSIIQAHSHMQLPSEANKARHKLSAAKTNSDGACALHAVFGHPTEGFELFAPNARQIAANALEAFFTTPTITPELQLRVEELQNQLWHEFTLGYLRNQHGSREAGVFWKCLKQENGQLCQEIESQERHRHCLTEELTATKKKAAQQSRALFSYQNQEFVQAFASKTQYLPDAVEVYWNRLKTKCHIVASGNTEKYEGMKSAKGNDGYIKGTRTRWPDEEEPFCKYAALFDHREEFDAIRESFIIHNEALSKPNIFATELEKYDVHNTYQDFEKHYTSG